MTIAQRMYALIISAFIGLAGLAVLGGYQMQRVFTAADYVSVNVVPSIVSLNKVTVGFSNVRSATWQIMALKDPEARREREQSRVENYDKAIAEIGRYEKQYVSDDKDREMIKADRRAIDAYKALSDKVVKLALDGKDDEADRAMQNGRALVGDLFTALESHSQYNIDVAERSGANAIAILGHARWEAAIIALLVIAAVAAQGLVTTRRLIKTLREAVQVAETVASGDLRSDIQVTSNDEIGQLQHALKNMSGSLVDIVGQVRDGTDAIAAASTQIAQGNLDLSARTESQASSLEQTAASMEELHSTVKNNTDNARHANQLAQSASAMAVKGGVVVSQVVETMGAINDASRQIANIIGTIDGIAFQTNILALNAAVESARAGEQGRGFAVVASEVRSLAQRSAAAAKEIKLLIDDSVQKVEAGSRLVDQAGVTMDDIVTGIRQVNDIMAEITSASTEQLDGITQVNEAVVAMDDATQQNAALVEESAAAATALQDQAVKLSEVVGVFKLNDTGAGRVVAAVSMPTPVPMPVLAPAPAPVRAAPPPPPQRALAARPARAVSEKVEEWEEF